MRTVGNCVLTYDQLPDHARLWIYAADRELTTEEVAALDKKIAEFASDWTSHRRDLDAFGGVWARRFLVLGVDEDKAAASGCSIDTSVRTVQKLGKELGVNFFEREIFFVLDGDDLVAYPKESFRAAYLRGDIHDDTTVLDPLVQTKAAAITGFRKPLSQSWHRRFVEV